jgi:putative ABC transport system permease protein
LLGLVLAALRARRAQAVTLFLLTLLAAASAAASPWYILASAESVATEHVETAKTSERIVEVTGKGPVPPGQTVESALTSFSTEVDDTLALPGFASYDSASLPGYATNGPESDNNRRQTASPMVYRPGICEHVTIEGACPSADNEVMISDRSARYLKLKTGDTLRYKAVDISDKQIQLKISGVYHATDPTDPYWFSAAGLLATAVPNGAVADITEPVDDAILISGDGLAARKPKQLLVVADRLASGSLFVESTPDVVTAQVANAKIGFENQNQQLSTGIGDLSARVGRDQSLIYLGVPAGAGQLLLLCWLALYLSVKYTGEERRPDIGLLKLRGASRSRIWAVVGGQSTVPMIVGAVIGIPLGFLVARFLAGSISSADVADRARIAAVAAAAIAVLGALLAALLAERRAFASSVNDLFRQVPSRGRAWRDLADLVVVVLAVAAVYQLHSRATADAAGLALLAPGLAALAIALLAARVFTGGASRLVLSALRNGRAGVALTAIYLARRPGIHRLCALLIVTVALLGTSGLAWNSGRQQANLRAEVEVGADRVVHVRADNRYGLLSAVRKADPSGRYAMAAVEAHPTGRDPVLLVDSPRLAAVAHWLPQYGLPTAAAAAAALHPAATAQPVMVTGGQLAVDVTLDPVADPTRKLFVQATLADAGGDRVSAQFGPLVSGQRQRLQAPTAACTKAPGCRLVDFAIVETISNAFVAAADGIKVTLHQVDQVGPDSTVLAGAGLADRARWRATAGPLTANLVITSGPAPQGGMALTVAKSISTGGADPGVYPMDAPVPLTALHAPGPKPIAPTLLGDDRITIGALRLPERAVAEPSVLPRLGNQGSLLDLEYTDRAASDLGGGGDDLQVWLTDDAPAVILDTLRADGMLVLSQETIKGAADRYEHLGPPLALRFTLGSALIGIVLAAGTVALVAAVERRPRGVELAALRAQGAPARLTRRVANGGYLILIGVSLVLGILAALLIRAVIGDVIEFFADGWKLP